MRLSHYLKAFFKTVKSASSGRGLERVFITGVSPVLMSDITSAYNVAKDIYDLQAACDFMEQRYFRVFDNHDYSSMPV
ncbi:MAG: AAA family ATPase [Pseudomonadota bacterium]